ncbi:NCAIR mutase (PurE)-related protein [Sporomusaceae bacterium BoRhaA]|uniref:nickel pincer cofactor biosynthesis protein LarB n=1 Tax=Pelorhabdus rhamnosifermentans TaxID=2772457 RepID=UPI001C061F24|nr:nickel pincer cofactor biosynthesis protein LarB [Pelorhabdus rhamnosifermentans]MBU2703037.1 NCAIR mutase (PurE)-related protein [Pelorhabdus rhamnosifermentans]
MASRERISNILDEYKQGALSREQVIAELNPYEELGFAKIDHQRANRQGFPEVVYAEGKTVEQVVAIVQTLVRRNNSVLATRATKAMYDAVRESISEAVYHELARLIVVEKTPLPKDEERFVLVLTAGTSDLPVAEEAAITAEVMGNKVKRIYDVGVAGIQRLLAQQEWIETANVIIVAAGMEGALASVVGGMAAKPVVAVPTSVGYGANFGGLSALLGMLNSCAAGVAVVNIDNGFGAGRLASLINHMR